jgi:hypothetical protein
MSNFPFSIYVLIRLINLNIKVCVHIVLSFEMKIKHICDGDLNNILTIASIYFTIASTA